MIAVLALRLQPGDPVWWRSRGQVHTGRVVDLRYQDGRVLRVTVYGYRGQVGMSYRRLHRVSTAAEQLEIPEAQHAPGRLLRLPLPEVRPRPVSESPSVEQGGLF